MHPHDSDEEFRRYDALSLAVQHARGRAGYTAADVIMDAEEFLNWLNNVEVN